MRVYQRKGVWYIDYSFNGRRVRRKVGTSKKMAELALKETELRIAKGEFLGVAERKKMTVDDLCDEYLKFSKSNKMPKSHTRDITSIKNLLAEFSGQLISDISSHALETYMNKRKGMVEPATVNREVSCMKHMFNKAVQWGYLSDNPIVSVKRFKEPPARIRNLTDAEIYKLLECCSDHLRSIVITALNTGMRKGEILNLQWSEVDMRNRIITLRKTKNNETRTIPINDPLHEELRSMGQQSHDQYVFCHENGDPYDDIKSGFKGALKRAGIKNFRFHDLRHTFASRLVMAGVDIRTVQELMGHKDIKMTMKYSHLSDAHLRDAVKRLEHGTNLAQGSLTGSQTIKKC